MDFGFLKLFTIWLRCIVFVLLDLPQISQLSFIAWVRVFLQGLKVLLSRCCLLLLFLLLFALEGFVRRLCFVSRDLLWFFGYIRECFLRGFWGDTPLDEVLLHFFGMFCEVIAFCANPLNS